MVRGTRAVQAFAATRPAASMEPCLFRHGKGFGAFLWRPTESASMEPCLFRHGKIVGARVHSILRVASMEPCLFRHGKGSPGVVIQGDLVVLQWSHVFSDMVSRRMREAGTQDRRASMEPCLFRHGKRRTGLNTSSTSMSFNGAMSFQTW